MKFHCVDFDEFSTYGRIPRNPLPPKSEENSTVATIPESSPHALPVYDIETIDYLNSILVFISHGWYSKQSPDTADHNKYRLIVEGVGKARNSLLAKDSKVYLWIDYSCLNQDQNVHADLISLHPLMKHVDLLFTPILAHGQLVENYTDYLEGYHAEGWDTGERAYLIRAWSRTELFYASSTVKQPDAHRILRFRAGLKAYASIGRSKYTYFSLITLIHCIPNSL